MRAAATIARVPIRPSAAAARGVPASSRSTIVRSSRVRHAVSRTSSVARHSLSAPERSASRVCGISPTSALPRPSSFPPAWGDSCRASATSAPTPRPRSLAGTPRAASWARREASSSAASTACAAHAAALRSSSAPSRSTRSASPSGSPTASPVADADTATVINRIDDESGSSEGPVNPGASGLTSCIDMTPSNQGPPTTNPPRI